MTNGLTFVTKHGECAYGFYDSVIFAAPDVSVNGEAADIDPECVSHDDYLNEFKSMLITKLRNSIDADIANDPDCVKGRKKTVQVSHVLFSVEFAALINYNVLISLVNIIESMDGI